MSFHQRAPGMWSRTIYSGSPSSSRLPFNRLSRITIFLHSHSIRPILLHTRIVRNAFNTYTRSLAAAFWGAHDQEENHSLLWWVSLELVSKLRTSPSRDNPKVCCRIKRTWEDGFSDSTRATFTNMTVSRAFFEGVLSKLVLFKL